MKILASIKDRKIIWDNPDVVSEYLLPLDGKEIEMIITRRKRSNKANAYYWAAIIDEIVSQIHKDTGQDEDDIHNHFKAMFLRYVNPIDGKVSIKSTTQLKSDEFARYVEKVKNQAAQEFNVVITEEI